MTSITPKIGLELPDYQGPRWDLSLNRNSEKLDSLHGIVEGVETLLETSIDIVDVFLYDTTKDPDNGAWRESTKETSWYNEILDNATRGKTRKFPAIVLVVAETDKVTLYDATDSSLPMWMVFIGASNNMARRNISSAGMINGSLSIGSTQDGLSVVSFKDDRSVLRLSSGLFIYNSSVSARNDSIGWGSTVGDGIVNSVVNNIAMTVLDGNDYPTIAVATDGGVSVISGPAGENTVVDITATTQATKGVQLVRFDNGRLIFGEERNPRVYVLDIPSVDTSAGWYSVIAGITTYSYDTTPALVRNEGSDPKALSIEGSDISVGTVEGLTLLKENPTTPAEGMVNYITSEYQSGWMQGDIKLATLADTTTETIGLDTETEHVVNGDFVTGLSGWTDVSESPGSAAVISGQLFLKNPNGTSAEEGRVRQIISTTVGQVYSLNVGLSGLAVIVQLGNTSSSGTVYQSPNSAESVDITFKATATETYLEIRNFSSAGDAIVDNVSIKAIQNLVSNGEFSSIRDWTLQTGWTISDRKASCNGDQTTNSNVFSDSEVEIGKAYVLSYELFEVSAGYITNARVGGFLDSTDRAIPGVYTVVGVATDDIAAQITASPDFEGSIGNVIVTELDIPDRSYNGNPLQVVGQLTKEPVNDGCELVSYSGFGVDSYIVQPRNSDLDFGAGDFCIMGWLKHASVFAGNDFAVSLSPEGGTNPRIGIATNSTGQIVFAYNNGAIEINTGVTCGVTGFTHVVFVRESGEIKGFINGRLEVTASFSENITNLSANLYIGAIRPGFNFFDGEAVLLRVGASTPSTEDIEHIYNTEKKLFETGAKCTLSGSTNSVTASSYDEETNSRLVGDDEGGLSEFVDCLNTGREFDWEHVSYDGGMPLNIVYPRTAPTVAVSALGGNVTQADAGGVFNWFPETNLLEVAAQAANVSDKRNLDDNNYSSMKIGDVLSGDYSEIEESGLLVFHGEARPWNDIVVNLHGAELHPTKSPVWVDYKGGRALEFSGTSDQTIYFDCQIPHSYEEGTDLEFHVHAIHQLTETGSVIWELTHSWANVGDLFPTESAVSKTFPNHEAQDVHGAGSVATLDGTGKEVSSILICSLTRKGSTDTSTDDSLLIGVDFHYLMDTIGSREEFTKS